MAHSFWISHQNPTSILLLPIRVTYTAHLFMLDFMIVSYEATHYAVFYNVLFYHSSVQIFSSASCSQITRICPSLTVRDQVSHPHKTTEKPMYFRQFTAWPACSLFIYQPRRKLNTVRIGFLCTTFTVLWIVTH
jgi:hypothetical protein